jgi:ketosteroid isomerase-like protein
MDQTEAQAFADAWIASWNAHDLDAVLAHYADDIDFRSPVAPAITGEPSGVVHGRDALRRYWSTGLARVPDLHFELLEVTVGIDAVALRYRNQAGRVVTEVAEFGDGRVVRAAAFYGEADVLRAVGAS